MLVQCLKAHRHRQIASDTRLSVWRIGIGLVVGVCNRSTLRVSHACYRPAVHLVAMLRLRCKDNVVFIAIGDSSAAKLHTIRCHSAVGCLSFGSHRESDHRLLHKGNLDVSSSINTIDRKGFIFKIVNNILQSHRLVIYKNVKDLPAARRFKYHAQRRSLSHLHRRTAVQC